MGGQFSNPKDESIAIEEKPSIRVVPFEPITEGTKFETNPPSEAKEFEKIIDALNSNNGEQSKKIVKESISSDSKSNENENCFDIGSCFLIRNVLSGKECEMIINASEASGYVSRKFKGDSTDSSSCVIWSEKLANTVFQRIKNELPNESYFDNSAGMTLGEFNDTKDNLEIKYYGNLDCINPHIRVERYFKSQSLKVHRDGCVLVKNKRNDHVYTVYAILIYLNDEFKGGNTEFAKDRKVSGNKMYTFEGIKGNIGDALVFRHEILHKGGKIDDGKKYVLRMDAAYKVIFDDA